MPNTRPFARVAAALFTHWLFVAPPSLGTAIAGQTGECDWAYPTVCIPVGSHELDCDDLEARSFPVEQDVHVLDSNGDGVGCGLGDTLGDDNWCGNPYDNNVGECTDPGYRNDSVYDPGYPDADPGNTYDAREHDQCSPLPATC